IGQNSATASSTITDVGGSNATSTGFAYGTTASYGATTTSTGSFAANTPTSATLSSLLCGTTYHFAAYATNANGIAYSSDATFTTSSCASPTVTTSAASSLAQTSATLNGSITATGGADATQSGFAYGTTSDLSAVIATSTLGAQTGAASFSSSVSSLTCNTTYYARAYATNGTGTGYGSIVSFTTSACSVAAAASAPAASETTVHPSSAHRREEVLVSAPAVSISSAGAPTLESFIKALISIGVIPADKAVMALSAVSASAPAVSVPHQNLSEGNVGESVRTLQKLLNEKGYTVSSSGAGSPGHETSIFGPATAKALKAFQKANGIPATGFFGPLTRAALGQ
ncbi:MAG TPA: peptidoglycan-binding protein, partial [Candidatus Paceibacterota bacterium]|nr:peptidoglycan-binding protein [Candidatus Paceibacterota bacterium]